MPKKKKKGTGKGKGGKKDDEIKTKEKKDLGPPPPSDKELQLKSELEELDSELETLVKQVDQLQKDNEWLQEESDKTRSENQDYQTFVSRRAQKRQSLIVSLNDQNQQELQQIQQEKEKHIEEVEHKKADLETELMKKESELSKLNEQLKLLEPYKSLQQNQEREISNLEKEVEEMTFYHENTIRALKTQFMREKKAYENHASARIKSMAEKANKQASQCLYEQSQRISQENVKLRAVLQELIEATGNLQSHKQSLEKQYQTLVHEQQFNMELQKLGGIQWSSFDSELNFHTS